MSVNRKHSVMEAGVCPRRDAGTVAGCDRARRDARALAGTVEGWRTLRIGRQGPSEGVSSCGGRVTALRKYICIQTICSNYVALRTPVAVAMWTMSS